MVTLTQPTPTILIVEDNPQINRLFCKQFSASGLETDGTFSVSETLRRLQTNPIPDVIVLDLELGDGNGIEILDYLQRSKCHDVQVIVVSAHAHSSHYPLHKFPVADVLVKPVSPRGLSVLVHNLLTNLVEVSER